MSFWLDLIQGISDQTSGIMADQAHMLANEYQPAPATDQGDQVWSDFVGQVKQPSWSQPTYAQQPDDMFRGYGNAGDLYDLKQSSNGMKWNAPAPVPGMDFSFLSPLPSPSGLQTRPSSNWRTPTGGQGIPGSGATGVEQWSPLIEEASATTGVPTAIIKTIMDMESSGRSNAVSSAGAMSLMQVMPFHFDPHENPFDPRTNIMRGAEILARNYALTRSWEGAAARYFGIGVDSDGTSTGQYVQKFLATLRKYVGDR